MPDLQPRHLLTLTDERPDDVAVSFDDQTLTAATLEERARRLATALFEAGVGPGQRCAIVAHNRIEWAEVFMGTARAGCRMALVNWHLTAAEMRELLVDSSARLLFVDPENEDTARAAAEGTDVERIIVFGAQYEDWLAAADDSLLPDHRAGTPLLYTGGTTGRSKGVTRSDFDRPVSSYATAYGRWGTLTQMPDHGVALIATPMYHALGNGIIQSALSRHHSVHILDRFDPEKTLAAIERHRVTTTAMVPTQFIRLLKADDELKSRYDVSSMQWVLHTAAPCPAWAKRGMIEWFGPVIVELYGSSEGTGPVIATSDEWLARPGTVGKASAALTLSIVDDDGNDLPAGEVGTVYAERPDGPPSYEGDPEKTAAMRLPDGRFTVGDVGWLDEDGFLFLADRRVDLMLVGGSNVYSAEIEGVMSQHADIGDVAVFGIPHPDMGQEIKAVVEPAPGRTIDTSDVTAWLAERLAKYKIPASIDVVDALPREEHGKLKKRLLRDPYWS